MAEVRPLLRARDRELLALVERFRAAAAGSPQLVVLSGPRRVGKSLLAHHALAADHGCRPV